MPKWVIRCPSFFPSSSFFGVNNSSYLLMSSYYVLSPGLMKTSPNNSSNLHLLSINYTCTGDVRCPGHCPHLQVRWSHMQICLWEGVASKPNLEWTLTGHSPCARDIEMNKELSFSSKSSQSTDKKKKISGGVCGEVWTFRGCCLLSVNGLGPIAILRMDNIIMLYMLRANPRLTPRVLLSTSSSSSCWWDVPHPTRTMGSTNSHFMCTVGCGTRAQLVVTCF